MYQRKVVLDNVELYLGDCLDVLSVLSPQSVDACITDPPFGIGFKYEKTETFNNPESYWNWFEPIYASILSTVKPGGFIAIWQTQLYFRHFWQWYGDDIHIYCAAKNFVQLRKTAVNFGYDPVVMKYLHADTLLRPQKPKRNMDFFVANTAGIVSNTNRIERQHPCPRPIDQTVQIVDNFSLPEGKVLDLFMGSGTTGVACVNTNRRFIGIEKEEKYFDIALERIQKAIDEQKVKE